MSSPVKYVENHNGKFLVLKGDQWIRHGIEHVDLIGFELRKFDQLLNLAKRMRPFQKDVVDGGSNMGSWTIPIALKHPDLTFHMFEVQRYLHWISCGNLALNHVLNARARWCGLGSQTGEIVLSVPDYNLAGNFGSFEVQKPFANSDCALVYSDHKDTVPVATVDSFNLNPILIKFDVEGMEWSCLQGASNTIANFEPIVWCERQKSDPETIIPWMTSRGYSLSYALEGHWTFLPPWIQNHPELETIIG